MNANRVAPTLLAVLVSTTGGLLINLNGCASSSFTSPGVPSPAGRFQHIVIIFQENRSTDNLFHDPVLMARGAEIANSGMNSHGQTIPLTPVPLGVSYDINHSHEAFVRMYDNGKMDGANLIETSCQPNCPVPNPQFHYVEPSEVAPYFQLAEQYTFGDRMFQTNEGPSFPAHQFIIAGTSAPSPNSNLLAVENGEGVSPLLSSGETGCLSPPTEFVRMIDPSGNESTRMYPCFEHATLMDELKQKGISWRYYTPSAGSLWTGPNAIQHLCGPNVPPPNATACVGHDWTSNVVIPETGVLTDIASGNLAQVSWVIPSGANSDHPRSGNGGPSWVAAIVNALGNSSYWSNTAIIIAWDDWGGWYDHVPPPTLSNNGSWGSGYVYGFRVPLIVVSPFAKPGYISHATHDFGSILNLVEKTFGLPSLGYADSRADDLSDCFDFNQSPIPFTPIAAPMKADFFLHDPRPRTDPDDD